jgi:hypothetical protein
MKTDTPTQDSVDPTLWHFNVSVNLNDAEITPDYDTLDYYVSARSRFGAVSVPVEGSANVWSKIGTPKTTWSEKLTFEIGAMNKYSFIVRDPRGDGILAAQVVSDCAAFPGGGASCSCEAVLDGGNAVGSEQMCTIAWNIDATVAPQDVNFEYSATNASQNKSNTNTVVTPFTGIIHLVNEK